MSAPTPEAIEAAARAIHSHQMVGLSELAWLTLDSIGLDYWTGQATAALSAAAPFIAAQAKAEALEEFADAHRMPFIMFNHDGREVTVAALLRAQAAEYRATIEGKSE